jgi:hypothetical protein
LCRHETRQPCSGRDTIRINAAKNIERRQKVTFEKFRKETLATVSELRLARAIGYDKDHPGDIKKQEA